MKTLFGTTIPTGTNGLVYLCDYDYDTFTIKPIREVFFQFAFMALDSFMDLDFYANTPNPASQLAMASNEHTFEEEVEILHNHMQDPEWQKQLANTL